MEYFVQHAEQKYGPYTLAEVQQYVQSGQLLSTDLAQSEGMTDWVPVSQILGNIPLPQLAQPVSAIPVQGPVALPPNLHWAVLLVLVIFTRQLFNWIWIFVQANWARRLSGNNKAMVMVAMYPAGLIAGLIAIGAGAASKQDVLTFVGVICIIGGLIAYILGIFRIRTDVVDYYNSRENIALELSRAMTFFFGCTYFQYHVNRIARWKKTGILD
jgi:hypothetical protein